MTDFSVRDPNQECERTHAPACLRAVLMHLPGSHPFWSRYQVALVHLRPMEGMPPARLRFPDASHEVHIFSLDPDTLPNPADPNSIRRLSPPDLAHQLRGLDDARALAVFDAFVRALDSRQLSPDSDFRRMNEAWLEHAASTS